MAKNIQAKMKAFGARSEVQAGLAKRTRGGLRRDDLVTRRNGVLMSVKELQKHRRHGHRNLRHWTLSLLKARDDLGLEAFMPASKGSALYVKAKEIQKGDPAELMWWCVEEGWVTSDVKWVQEHVDDVPCPRDVEV